MRAGTRRGALAASRTSLGGTATSSGESPAPSSGVSLFVLTMISRLADVPTRCAGARALAKRCIDEARR